MPTTISTAAINTFLQAGSAAAARAAVSAVGTVLEITTLLQGTAADATKIGKEYMPDELDVDSIGLSDTSAVTLPDGSLGLDASGGLVLHNGTDSGGVSIFGKRAQGKAIIDVSLAASVKQVIEVARCRIPSGENTNASKWLLTGRVVILPNISNWTGAITPRFGFFLSGSTAEASGSVNRGWNAAWDDSTEIIRLDFAQSLEMVVTGGNTTFSQDASLGSVRNSSVAGGTETLTYVALASGGIPSQRLTASGDIDVIFYIGLDVDASGADCTGNALCFADLQFTKVS